MHKLLFRKICYMIDEKQWTRYEMNSKQLRKYIHFTPTVWHYNPSATTEWTIEIVSTYRARVLI